MPRGGRRANAGRPKGSRSKKPLKPNRAFIARLKAADSHAAVRLLGDKLAEQGDLEAAARTIAKIVRYETSPMATSRRDAPLSARQQQLMFAFPAPAPAKADAETPDEFAALLQ